MVRNFIITFAVVLLACVSWLAGRSGQQVQKNSQTAEPSRSADVSIEIAQVPYLVSQLLDSSNHLSEQVDALHELPSDLTEQELMALMAYLRQPMPATISSARWLNLANEIMVVLRQPRFEFAAYPTEMSSIVQDQHLSPMIRDYAVQHLTLYLEEKAGVIEPQLFAHCLEALMQPLEDNRRESEGVAATSLMSLCDFHQRLGTRHEAVVVNRPEFEALVQSYLVPESGRSVALRIAAIQAAGRLQIPSATSTIRELASEDSPEHMLRLSSISALGMCGDIQDKHFLTDLAKGSSKYRFAAQAALTNLENKLVAELK